MRVLIDMNLSPEWVAVLTEAGLPAIHWSEVGQSNDTDQVIYTYARKEGWIILTQDLDFSQILFATAASGPSTVLLRLGDELAGAQRRRVIALIIRCRAELEAGALLVIDERKARLRLLPLNQ